MDTLRSQVRRTPGFTDKQATQQLASDLEKQAARDASGLIDRFHEHRKRPLSEHVKDWRTALLAKGGTETHADLVTGRVSSRRYLLYAALTVTIGRSAVRSNEPHVSERTSLARSPVSATS